MPVKILIAESKSMTDQLYPLKPAESRTPIFANYADNIMKVVSAMTPAEATAMLHCSGRMGINVVELAKKFMDKSYGIKAIDAFTGVVFRSLDYPTLPQEASSRCQDQVRIISSAYGLLRPEDCIRPYRLEMGAVIPGMDISLKKFWKKEITIFLGKYLKSAFPEGGLILILPADALYCIDLKILRSLGDIAVVELRTYNEEGKLVTPRAERLKNRRGLLVRQLLETGISKVKDLESFTSPDFLYLGQEPYPGRYVFIC